MQNTDGFCWERIASASSRALLPTEDVMPPTMQRITSASSKSLLLVMDRSLRQKTVNAESGSLLLAMGVMPSAGS